MKPHASKHAEPFFVFWQVRRCNAAPAGFELAVRPLMSIGFVVNPVIPAWISWAQTPFGAPVAVRSKGAALQSVVLSVPQ